MSIFNDETKYAVVFFGGETIYFVNTIKEAMDEAQLHVNEMIGNHHRRELPMKVSPELARDLNIHIFALNRRSVVDMPVQMWFDLYYKEQQDYERETTLRPYETYLELKARFEGEKSVEDLKELSEEEKIARVKGTET